MNDATARSAARAAEADWLRAAAAALAAEEVAPAHRRRLLAEARAVVVATQEDPEELFGAPEDWAAQACADAAEAGEPLTDARITTGADVLRVGFVLAGAGALLAFLLTLLKDGLTTDVSLGVLLVPPVVGVGGMGVLWGWERLQRHVPTVAAAGAAVCLAGALLAALAVLMVSVGDAGLAAGVSSFVWLGVAAVCGVLSWVAARLLPERDADQGLTPDSEEEWAARLAFLLRSRADVPEGRVGEIVAEARAHAADAGTTLAEEFGSPASYAARVPRDRVHRARTTAALTTVAAAAVVGAMVGVLVPKGEAQWWHWLVAAGTVAAAVLAWVDVRRAAAGRTDEGGQ
ncbi:hypothetical protein [Micrococcus endophyticus]|uniref:Uncharacterized protein n=1 Tax=Micrococcus endophyticus TaxID=455343 RepID=A0A7W9JLA9_9MICC|nr:hypothetical protein [Micrococcus endophyticus]MBB5849714.1 hypothetical protein [Micrococcus endophyticus]